MGWTLTISWLGRQFEFHEVLATLSEDWAFFKSGRSVRSASFSVVFPPDIDPALLVSQGHRLAGATGSLSLDGVVHLIGLLEEPRFGRASHPVEFTVREAESEDGGLIPDTFDVSLYSRADLDRAARIEDARDTFVYLERFFPRLAGAAEALPFPAMAPEHVGRVMTVVWGRSGRGGPGLDSDGIVTFPATPAPVIDNTPGAEKILVAGHLCGAGVVRVWGPDAAGELTSVGATVESAKDAFGRDITRVTTAGLLSVDESRTEDEWYIGWDSNAEPLPGGAGDVLMLFLRHTTYRLDFNRLGTLVPALNARYQLAGYLDEQVSPSEWIADHLLPILPIAPVWGRDGLYYAMWDPDAPVVDRFVAGPEAVFDAEMQYSDVAPVNRFQLNYSLRIAPKEQYRRTAMADRTTTVYAAVSEARYGLRTEMLDSDVVQDRETAERIVLEQVRRRALPPLFIGADCRRSRYDARSVGDLVELSIPELSIVDRPAHIVSVTRDGSPTIRVGFALLEDPLR